MILTFIQQPPVLISLSCYHTHAHIHPNKMTPKITTAAAFAAVLSTTLHGTALCSPVATRAELAPALPVAAAAPITSPTSSDAAAVDLNLAHQPNGDLNDTGVLDDLERLLDIVGKHIERIHQAANSTAPPVKVEINGDCIGNGVCNPVKVDRSKKWGNTTVSDDKEKNREGGLPNIPKIPKLPKLPGLPRLPSQPGQRGRGSRAGGAGRG